MPRMLLPDVNVWLALAFDSHVHHPVAKLWFDSLSNEVCFGMVQHRAAEQVKTPHPNPPPQGGGRGDKKSNLPPDAVTN